MITRPEDIPAPTTAWVFQRAKELLNRVNRLVLRRRGTISYEELSVIVGTLHRAADLFEELMLRMEERYRE